MTDNYGNGYSQENTYQRGYMQGEIYNQPNQKKGDATGFGIASLALGIVSLLLFCTGINWITGILSIVFGTLQIARHRERGFALGGIITSGISRLLAVVLYISMAFSYSAYDGSENRYYNDYHHDYYRDDYEDGDGSGAEFLRALK